MELNVNRADLEKGISAVSKAIPSKTTMSILQCIYIDATGGFIRLVANDMELGIQAIVPGEIVKKGAVCLKSNEFAGIIRNITDEIINIQVDDKFLTKINYADGKGNMVLRGRDPESYTDIPDMKKEDSLEITQFTLKELIRQTIFSIGNNDTNRVIGGELFQIQDGYFKIMSLDGQRVSIRRVEIEDKNLQKKVIVPGKSLNELIKIINGDTTKYVSIYFMANHISFEFEDITVVTRLIDGDYINIDSILSTDYETKVMINKRKFVEALNRSTVIVSEGDKKPVILNFTDGNMNIRLNAVDNSMNEDCEIIKEGKDIMIGFNPKFLIDALRVIDQEDVDLYFINPKAPCFIRDKEESYTYLVLPINFTTVD